MITGFRHTGIVVSDLAAAEHFWCELMGFIVNRRMDESGSSLDAMLGLQNVSVTTLKLAAPDGTVIELLKFHSHPEETTWGRTIHSTGLTHLAFTVEDLGAEYKRLSSHGILFHAPPQESPDGAVLVTFCEGPEGILVELVEQRMAHGAFLTKKQG
jgi:catechol 2,3-dioxygenase-like lactoylglutathione lyase family enzyme